MVDGGRNFVATVKELPDGRLTVLVESYEDVGFDGKQLTLTLPAGSSYGEAEALALRLNSTKVQVRLEHWKSGSGGSV
ncbi:hypothetical protein [Bosea sp. Tri-44]|uniref:hypothetical protein n=1 Tax=Bosea sp. Tri-44 TaxID=1972137 RepID=UPI00100E6A3E|nr:hypothetical protein [Bosea sp. Tri-44]